MTMSSRVSSEANGNLHAHNLYDLAQEADRSTLKKLIQKVRSGESLPLALDLSDNALFHLMAETNYNDLVIADPNCPLQMIMDMVVDLNPKTINISWNHYYIDKNQNVSWDRSDPNREFANIWAKLASAFANISSLNCSWNQLNEHEHFKNFCRAFENKDFNYLDLSFNKLNKPADIASLARLKVRSLKFCGNFTEDSFSEALFDQLLTLFFNPATPNTPLTPTALRVLNVSHNKLHCLSDTQFAKFCDALSKSQVVTLIVNEPLNEKEKVNLKNVAQFMGRYPRLTKHSVASNQFEDAQINILHDIVQKNRLKELPSLKLLAMRKLWCESNAKVSALSATVFQSNQRSVKSEITNDLKEDIEQMSDVIGSPIVNRR